MLTLLQARTPFRSSHIVVNPAISLESYINMYEQDLIKPVRRAFVQTKRPRSEGGQAAQGAQAHEAHEAPKATQAAQAT